LKFKFCDSEIFLNRSEGIDKKINFIIESLNLSGFPIDKEHFGIYLFSESVVFLGKHFNKEVLTFVKRLIELVINLGVKRAVFAFQKQNFGLIVLQDLCQL
jgi:hypothetical protein